MRFVLAGSGHIAGVVNPPAKASTSTGPARSPTGADVEDWLKKAKEAPGSWWPDWLDWIEAHGDERVPAREPGGGKLKPIEDAPGSYVKVKA